jgi:hypothetical protein
MAGKISARAIFGCNSKTEEFGNPRGFSAPAAKVVQNFTTRLALTPCACAPLASWPV